MKAVTSITFIKKIIHRMLSGTKIKYLILLLQFLLISVTLPAQEIAWQNDNIQTPDQKASAGEPLLQHLLLSVQINPPHNQRISDYAGLPINILSSTGQLISAGLLDQNGQVRFDELTKTSLKEVHIYIVATEDKITIKNPYGAVVGLIVSSPDRTKDI